jgi:hypothetical protein
LQNIKKGIKRPPFNADFTKSGEKVPTQFCLVFPHATINTSVKLENRRVWRKSRMLTQVMAANLNQDKCKKGNLNF